MREQHKQAKGISHRLLYVLKRDARKAVDTLFVLLLTVMSQAFRPLLAGPGVELFTLALVFETRNAVAARIGDARQVHDDDRAGVIANWEVFRKGRKLGVVRFDDASAAVQAENIRRTLECAEHQNDSPILFQMSDGLHSIAVEINVGDGGWIEDAKCIQPFRRQVYMAGGIQRGRGHEKDILLFDESACNVIDHGTRFAHGYSWILRTRSARGTETCSPVARFFRANASALISFSPTIKMYFAPALVAVSNDFFSRKVSSPKSATTSWRRSSRASRAASAFMPAPSGAIYTSGLHSTLSAGVDSCNDITRRSSPIAKPIPGAAGPPSASESPS